MSLLSKFDFELSINREDTGSIKWEKYNSDIIPMWVADMEFATAPEIITAMKQRLDHPILGYTQATSELTSTVTNYLVNRHKWTIDPEWLSWVPGVVPGVAACTNMIEPDEEVLVFTPVYHPLLIIPNKYNRPRVDVPLSYVDSRWSIDFDAFEKAITKQSRMLLLCSPHNPVGTIFTAQELRRVVEICAEHNILLVSDEIHCDLVLHASNKHLPTGLIADDLGKHVITLMSPSKTFNLAGANCSFAIIPDPEVRKQFDDQCMFTVPIVPTLSYTATQAAFTHGWDWHQQLIDHLRGNLAYLRDEIAAMPYLWMDDIEATYLAWINTRDLPVDDACEFLLKAGVGLSPGAQFGDGNYQRLNFACSRAQLKTGIDRIRTAISTLS